MIAGRLIENRHIANSQGIRRGTDFPFHGKQLRPCAAVRQGREEKKPIERKRLREQMACFHESDPSNPIIEVQEQRKPKRQQQPKSGVKHCGNAAVDAGQHTCFRGWQYMSGFTEWKQPQE
jgi:hypothetical protein